MLDVSLGWKVTLYSNQKSPSTTTYVEFICSQAYYWYVNKCDECLTNQFVYYHDR